MTKGFRPSHPGEVLTNVYIIGHAADRLAFEADMDGEYVRCVLEGTKPMTEKLAKAVDALYGTGAGMWMEMQKCWEEDQEESNG